MQVRPAFLLPLAITGLAIPCSVNAAADGQSPVETDPPFYPDRQQAEQGLAEYDKAIETLEAQPSSDSNDEAITDLGYAKRQYIEVNGLPMFTFLGGPAYTPEQGILLAAGGLYSFKTERQQQSLQRSNVSLFVVGNYVDNQIGYGLRAKHNLFWDHNNIQFIGEWNAGVQSKHYWGIGYDKGQQFTLGDETKQTVLSNNYHGDLAFRIHGNWFAGPSLALDYYSPQDDTDPASAIDDPNYAKFKDRPFILGLGATLAYDSRDVAVNAWQGQYAKATYLVFNEAIGSQANFEQLQLEHRYYYSLSPGQILASFAQFQQSYGDTPYYAMPTLGGPNSLRGYYMGQYRDNTVAELTGEYRHTFRRQNGGLSNHGMTLWSGVGFVADKVSSLSTNPLFSYGIGYRYQVQPRMNVRLDLGFSEHGAAFYFNFTEAF
ncbi:BamA/TamA family outer membrane protein [Photobacterium satsumensis]|uniref:BamA/TamA family outer membrane protein n=1 Tax=Photobacterium satsumensis TaxID=2910239 RepID=UPI003D12F789